MLRHFQQKIESAMGCEVNQRELICAIEVAKNDVITNNLLFGKDVSSEYFEEVVCSYIKCSRSGISEKADTFYKV